LFEIDWTDTARETYKSLKADVSQKKRYKAVRKAIRLLAQDPYYPSLQTHPYHSIKGPKGEKVFIAYAEQNTPGAYRILWYYGPLEGVITIFVITSHY
jgi:hypothetical protein